MLRKTLIVFGMLMSFTATSCGRAPTAQPTVSAIRAPGETWRAAFALNFSERSPIESVAQPYRENLDVSGLPEWTMGLEDLTVGFTVSRDERIYSDPASPKFARRALWLYPNDACFVRAAHVAKSFERQAKPRPGKIFVFGNLRLKSPYDPRGEVYWSYHVASAFRVNGRALVLDAAVEPTRPLELREWLARISSDPSRTRVSVCDTFSYTPLNPCTGGSRVQESSTESHLREYLPDEWRRLQLTNHQPEKLLGDEPPWLSPP